jgi:hypothetical protein
MKHKGECLEESIRDSLRSTINKGFTSALQPKLGEIQSRFRIS